MSVSPTTTKYPFGPPDRWFILSLVALDYFVLYLHRAVLGFIQPSLIAEINLTDTQLGWLQPAFIVPYTVSQLFVAYLSDRFRRRSILLCSLFGSVVVLGAMGCANSFSALVILRVCLGLAQAASVPAIAGIMADCFTPKKRSTAVSIYLMSYMSAVFVAGSLGGKIADTPAWTLPFGEQIFTLAGWRLALIGFSLVGASAVVLLFFFLREPERTERKADEGLGVGGGEWFNTVLSVVRTPSFLLLATIFILVSIIANTREFFLARYFHDSFGMTEGEAGWFSTVWIQPAQFVGLLIGGICADYWARRWRGGRAAMASLSTVAYIPALLIIGTSRSTTQLAVAMVVFGVAQGVYISNLWTTYFEVVDPAARSTATGLMNVFSTIAGFTGPFIGGLKHNGTIDNFGTAFAWLSVVAAAAVVLYVVHIAVTLPRVFRTADTE